MSEDFDIYWFSFAKVRKLFKETSSEQKPPAYPIERLGGGGGQ